MTFLTVKEAALKASKTELTIRNWIKTGLLPATQKMRGARMSTHVKEVDLLALLTPSSPK